MGARPRPTPWRGVSPGATLAPTGREFGVERRRRSVRKLIACGVALIAALALLVVPGAFGGEAQVPGVTARSITVGGTFPLSGGAAAYAPIPVGMRAYFSYVNATRTGPDKKRGVYGRQIIWKYYDDKFIPSETERLTRRL